MKEIFLKAAEIIEQGWCQNQPAKNAAGKGVSARETEAVQWCAMGALVKVTTDFNENFANCMEILEKHVGTTVGTWNDQPNQTQANVAATLRELGQ
jgi:hypothetical protein